METLVASENIVQPCVLPACSATELQSKLTYTPIFSVWIHREEQRCHYTAIWKQCYKTVKTPFLQSLFPNKQEADNFLSPTKKKLAFDSIGSKFKVRWGFKASLHYQSSAVISYPSKFSVITVVSSNFESMTFEWNFYTVTHSLIYISESVE